MKNCTDLRFDEHRFFGFFGFWATRLMMALSVLFAWAGTGSARAADGFLDPDQAFRISAQALDDRRVAFRFDIAPGYYLYREQFKVVAAPATVALGALELPQGQRKFEEAFQKEVEYFRGVVTLVVPLKAALREPVQLTVTHQGCADKGICYPPSQHAFQITPGQAGAALRVSSVDEPRTLSPSPSVFGSFGASPASRAVPSVFEPSASAPDGQRTAGGTASPDAPAHERATGNGADGAGGAGGAADVSAAGVPSSEPGRISQALHSGNLLAVIGLFLLLGIGLSFTPCVLPMMPILSSIIVGQGGPVSRARGFALALAYSLGMALVYTALGVASALAGEGLGAALQNAWVLGAFSVLLALLSLSMFGAYELQVPQALQSRLTRASQGLQGGRYVGVFLMGGLSALIVGPCVAAPLAGALVYISQTRDALLGGTALFSLAAGMSLPLLLIGVSAGALLPRAGAWMAQVKHGFGLLLLMVALWMVSPVLPISVLMLLTAVWLLVGAVFLGAFERLPSPASAGRVFAKGLGLALAMLAALQLVGAASGGREWLQPLASLRIGSVAAGAAARAPLQFQPIANLAELEAAVQASARPVMLDFYADWCVSCKEFEALTFTDGAVRQKMAGLTLLRADVTANNEQDRALLRRFSLFGPPAMLFFSSRQGLAGELSALRVIGFQPASAFSAHLDQVGLQAGAKAAGP